MFIVSLSLFGQRSASKSPERDRCLWLGVIAWMELVLQNYAHDNFDAWWVYLKKTTSFPPPPPLRESRYVTDVHHNKPRETKSMHCIYFRPLLASIELLMQKDFILPLCYKEIVKLEARACFSKLVPLMRPQTSPEITELLLTG